MGAELTKTQRPKGWKMEMFYRHWLLHPYVASLPQEQLDVVKTWDNWPKACSSPHLVLRNWISES